MTADITNLPTRDPFFALIPELRPHLSDVDGALVVNSREVARVSFHRKHRRVLRKIMRDIWDMPMQPNYEDEYRLCEDGTVDITSTGLTSVLSHWGFHNKNKRLREFRDRFVKLIVGAAKEIEAQTGRNPLRWGSSCSFPTNHPDIHPDSTHSARAFGCSQGAARGTGIVAIVARWCGHDNANSKSVGNPK